MTIEQTIEIPASHRVTFEVPPEIPIGKARILVTSIEEPPKTETSLLSLRGSCKGFDTMDAYFARKKADKVLENLKDNRIFGNS